jgi:hypothetical protein
MSKPFSDPIIHINYYPGSLPSDKVPDPIIHINYYPGSLPSDKVPAQIIHINYYPGSLSSDKVPPPIIPNIKSIINSFIGKYIIVIVDEKHPYATYNEHEIQYPSGPINITGIYWSKTVNFVYPYVCNKKYNLLEALNYIGTCTFDTIPTSKHQIYTITGIHKMYYYNGNPEDMWMDKLVNYLENPDKITSESMFISIGFNVAKV